MMKVDKQLRLYLGILAVAVLFLAFTALVLVAFFSYVLPLDDPQLHFSNLLIIVFAFAAFLGATILLGRELFIQFTQHFYHLTWEEAEALTDRLTGVRSGPRFMPTLRVQDGRANPDGPPVLFKVGGPGNLSVAHNSAAVTSRLGKLNRVLGPGFHHLDPFERLWDVIDLRPQRRTIRVEFMTSDGIPAYCEAEIRFRIAAKGPKDETASADDTAMPNWVHSFLLRLFQKVPKQTSDEKPKNQPYSFSKTAILDLTTSKFVKKSEGANRTSDWCIGLVNGILDGEVRDLLETYRLDQFLSPRYADTADNQAATQTSTPQMRPVSLQELETIIEEKVKQTGRERGINVNWVRLEPVRPSEEVVFNQWMAFWQARSDRGISKSMLESEAKRAERLEKARIEAQVEFLITMLQEVQKLSDKKITVPSELIVMSFVDVVRTLSERDPAVQQMMFHQAESLIRVVNAVRKDKSPFGQTTLPAQALSTSGAPLDPDASPDEALS